MAIEAGSAEVVVRGNIVPLEQSLNTGEAALAKFDASVTKFAAAVESKFNKSVKKGAAETSSFVKGLSNVTAGLGLIPGPAGAAAARLTSVVTVAGSLGPAGLAAAAGFAAMTGALTASVEVAGAFERSNARTEALLKATGHAAGLTGGQIRDLALEIDDATLANEQDVEKAAQALITFGNTSGEEFKRTLTLAQDLAAATGGDLSGAVTKLGLAFDRPEAAARRFRDIGLHEVVFLQAQAFKEAGKQAEAHGVILDAIQKKVGGAGAAEGQGLAGSYDRMGDATERFLVLLGNSGPLQVWTSLIDKMAAGVEGFTRDIFGATNAIKMGAKDGIVAREAAKKGAEIAAAQRTKDDAEAVRLKKAREDAKKAADEAESQRKAEARALEELNQRRSEAVDMATEEASALERLIPELLNNGTSIDEINGKLQDEMQLLRQLARLKLDRGSGQGAEIEQQLQKRSQLLLSLNKELKTREMLKDASMGIRQIDEETQAIGKSETAAARMAFQLDLLNKAEQAGIPVTGKLSAEISALGDSFEKATSANKSAKFFDDLTEEMANSERQLSAMTATLGMSAGKAAAYNYEQENLYRLTKLNGKVTPEQAAQIHKLADEYGHVTDQIQKLQAVQESNDFFNGQFSQTLSDIVFEAKDIGSAFHDMGKAIAKAAFEAALFGKGPLGGLFGGTTGGGGGGLLGGLFSGGAGGAGGGLGGMLGSLFHEGGSDPGAMPKRHVPVATFIRAPRLHDGLRADEFPAILQRGEEVTSRKDVKSGKGGGATYIWNVQTPDANSFMASRRQVTAQAKRQLQ